MTTVRTGADETRRTVGRGLGRATVGRGLGRAAWVRTVRTAERALMRATARDFLAPEKEDDLAAPKVVAALTPVWKTRWVAQTSASMPALR